MGKKAGYLQRLVVSYGIAIFIPVMLLCMLIYRVGIVEVQQRAVRTQELLLAQAAETLNTRLRECDEISTLLSMDQTLIHLSEKLEPWEIREGVQTLSGYAKANSFFSDIVIWRYGERMVFTAKGTEWLEVMLGKHPYTATELARFDQIIRDGQAHLVHFKGAGVLMKIVPIPLLARNHTGCALFIFDDASFNGLFAPRRQEDYGAITLVDQNGVPVYTHGDPGAAGEALLEAAVAARAGEGLLFDGRRYTVVDAAVEASGWRFVSLMPDTWTTSGLYIGQMITWISIIIFVALVIALLLVRRQYIPIRELARKTGEQTAGNEIQHIGSALDSMAALRTQAEQHRRLLHGAVLERLLHSSVRSTQEIAQALASMRMFVDKERLCVYAIGLHDQGQEAREALLAWLGDGYLTPNEVYTVAERTAEAQTLFAICGFPAENVEEERRALACELMTAAKKLGGASIGVGLVRALHDTSVSYLEASIALEHGQPNAQPVFFDDIREIPRLNDAFQEKLALLIYSLKSHRAQSFAELMEELLDMLGHDYQSKILWRYYAFQLTEGIVRHLSQEGERIPEGSPAFLELTQELTLALSMHSLEDYLRQMRRIAEQMVELLGTDGHAHGTQGYVMGWIEENVKDPLLSLNLLSETFGFSQAYWSRYVKEQTGKNFNDLIWTMRCEIVKEQLVRTVLPIKQIVQEAGYIDVSSFARRFKQSEHLTPGQYRISHRQQ